ncbi:MAG: hypothetical protein Q9170_002907 [Blastenia crenularia]
MADSTMVARIILALLTLLPALSSAWICFPPVQALPTRTDCVALILGLDHISKLPADQGAKRWGRHLSTGPRTEKLPRWYYIVNEAHPPATCAIMVDSGGDPGEVDTFLLADVVDAAKDVYSACLVEKGQVGLEFPGNGHIYAQLKRLDTTPGKLNVASEGNGNGLGRTEALPDGRVLYILDTEPGTQRNGSQRA